MKSLNLRPHLIYLFLVLIFYQCNPEPHTSKQNLDEAILSDTSSFYYVDVKNYPVKNKKLPIGIFDSGTGGLTVMDAIVNYDGFNNQNKSLTTQMEFWILKKNILFISRIKQICLTAIILL